MAGHIYCWGTAYGPVHDRPQRVHDAPPFVEIQVGASFTNVHGFDMLCGLAASGTAHCRSELGPAFVEIPAQAPFSSVAVGTATCAATDTGDAFCWTYSLFGGVLGNGTLSNDGYVGGTVVAVAGNLRFTALAAGPAHVCGIAQDRRVHCWGRHNFALQMGDGDSSDLPRPIPVPVAGGFTFESLSVGDVHTCGVGTSGTAYCWGFAFFGQLGNSQAPTTGCPGIGSSDASQPMTCVASPVAVAGGYHFTSVAAGGAHTCGLVADGRAFCWGSAAWGQLGNGRSGPYVVEREPVPVAGGVRFRDLVAGGEFTCGIAVNDATYCWGRNQAGQLGAGLPLGHGTTIPHPITGHGTAH